MSYSPGGAGGSGAISGLGDVALSSPGDAHYLGYNAGLQKWQNHPRPPRLVETVYTATVGASATIPDVTSATISFLTLTADCTLFFPPSGAGKTLMITLRQDNAGSHTVAWPVNVLWTGGIAPTLSTGGTRADVLSFICVDGGNWLGFVSGQGF